MRILLTLSLISASTQLLFSQEIAYPRRLSNVSTFLNKLEDRPDPVIVKRKGTVKVVFRTSERGTVLYVKAIKGSKELTDTAVELVKNWKFKPVTISGGQPIEMISAAILDFSTAPITIRPSEAMTAQELSPGLPAKCLNALLSNDPAVLDTCRQQLQSIENSDSADVNRLTAEDEFGIALLRAGHRSSEALRHFQAAIQLAPSTLTAADAEWGYLYWHRAVAERESGMNTDAQKDFVAAEETMNTAARGIGTELAAAYYQRLAVDIAKQREALPSK